MVLTRNPYHTAALLSFCHFWAAGELAQSDWLPTLRPRGSGSRVNAQARSVKQLKILQLFSILKSKKMDA